LFPSSPDAYHPWILCLVLLILLFFRLHFPFALRFPSPASLPRKTQLLEQYQTQVWLFRFSSWFREFTKRIRGSKHFYYWTTNERYREWEDELPWFNESPEVPDDVDPSEHPLRLHRLRLNRREDSSIFTAGCSFLPARNQTTIRQRLHRPEGHLPQIFKPNFQRPCCKFFVSVINHKQLSCSSNILTSRVTIVSMWFFEVANN